MGLESKQRFCADSVGLGMEAVVGKATGEGREVWRSYRLRVARHATRERQGEATWRKRCAGRVVSRVKRTLRF
jgi:hypothetical protein